MVMGDSYSSTQSSNLAAAFVAGLASASLIHIWSSSGLRHDGKDAHPGDDKKNSTDSTGSWIENVKSRIGELPVKLPRKTRWPWDKIRRKKIGSAGDEASSKYLNSDDSEEEKEPEKKDLCIGSIFGLDVGGTLAKLVYFEQKSTEYQSISLREKHNHRRASALAVLEARRGRSKTTEELSDADQKQKRLHNIHSELSDQDLKDLSLVRHVSEPGNLNEYASTCDGPKMQMSKLPSRESFVRGTGKKEGESRNGEGTSGMGMRRPKSMLDLTQSRDHAEALDRFYNFAKRLDSYETAVKEKQLSFYSRALGGEFHFIRFETRHMENAMDLIHANNLHLNIREMGATGGGAYKYADDWQRVLGIEIAKKEELDSLVAGMQFVLSTVVGECYTFRPTLPQEQVETTVAAPTVSSHTKSSSSNDSEGDDDSSVERNTSPSRTNTDFGEDKQEKAKMAKSTDDEWWSNKVQRDSIADSSTYPYLLVTIGTGVSILRVDGPRKHERVSGSTIGGGTYWGLIRLLTDVDDYDSAMNLAERGDPTKVDMTVGDIYGQDSDALEKVGLPSNLVASSFGKLVAKQDPSSGVKQEDLARALLLMVTNNIGQVAYLNAQLHNTPRIHFVGNFLRHNKISQQRLAYAINYWSKGEMEGLFLEHEGYFGALGAFLLNQNISE